MTDAELIEILLLIILAGLGLAVVVVIAFDGFQIYRRPKPAPPNIQPPPRKKR